MILFMTVCIIILAVFAVTAAIFYYFKHPLEDNK